MLRNTCWLEYLNSIDIYQYSMQSNIVNSLYSFYSIFPLGNFNWLMSSLIASLVDFKCQLFHIFILSSAAKRLITSKIKVCLHNICVYCIYFKHTYSIYFENIYLNLHVYIYIHKVYIIYKYIYYNIYITFFIKYTHIFIYTQ